MKKDVFLCDTLHFESGRGMWRYNLQLRRHFDLMGVDLSAMPSALKPVNSNLLQLFAYEIIEPCWSMSHAHDLVLCPFNVAPFIHRRDSPLATVVHDLIFLQKQHASWGARYRRAKIKRTMAHSDFIISISASVRDEICRTFSTKNPPYVIPCQLGDVFASEFQRAEILRSAPRILHLGGLASSKGTELLLGAFTVILQHCPQAKLVLAAMSKNREWVSRVAANLGLPYSAIEILPRLTDAELAQQYADATIHCMPSRGEGFGMPIIEAASQGTINVLSPLPVFREILGKDAVYFREWTPESLAESLVYALDGNFASTTARAQGKALGYSFENIHKNAAIPAFNEIFKKIEEKRMEQVHRQSAVVRARHD